MQVLNTQARRPVMPVMPWTHKDLRTHNGNPAQGGLTVALTEAPIILVGAVIFTVGAVVTFAGQIRRGAPDLREMIRQANL